MAGPPGRPRVRPGDTILVHAGTYTYNRYEYTNNWNLIINARQFGGVPGELNLGVGDTDTSSSAT